MSYVFCRLMYRAESRRIKGAGREGRQYEAVVREGTLKIGADCAILPSGELMFGGGLLGVAMAAAQRDGWLIERETAEVIASDQAQRRDSEPVRNLRKLAMRQGHGGNRLHVVLGAPKHVIAEWRNGIAEMPEETAAKIAQLLA